MTNFTMEEYEFLKELGIGPQNLGCYVNGTWKATGPVISTVNPASNQVSSQFHLSSLIFPTFCLVGLLIFTDYKWQTDRFRFIKLIYV